MMFPKSRFRRGLAPVGVEQGVNRVPGKDELVERYGLQILTPRLRSNTCSALQMCVEWAGGGWKGEICTQCTLLRAAASRLARHGESGGYEN